MESAVTVGEAASEATHRPEAAEHHHRQWGLVPAEVVEESVAVQTAEMEEVVAAKSLRPAPVQAQSDTRQLVVVAVAVHPMVGVAAGAGVGGVVR